MGWGYPIRTGVSPISQMGVSLVRKDEGTLHISHMGVSLVRKDEGTLLISQMGIPSPPGCEQTENITFCHPSDGSGQNTHYIEEQESPA